MPVRSSRGAVVVRLVIGVSVVMIAVLGVAGSYLVYGLYVEAKTAQEQAEREIAIHIENRENAQAAQLKYSEAADQLAVRLSNAHWELQNVKSNDCYREPLPADAVGIVRRVRRETTKQFLSDGAEGAD